MIKSRNLGVLVLLADLGGCTEANNTFTFDAAADAASPVRSDVAEAGLTPDTSLADRPLEAGLPDLAVNRAGDVPFDIAIGIAADAANATVE